MHNRDQSGPKLPTLICQLELVCTSREGGRGPKKAQEKVKGGADLKMALSLNALGSYTDQSTHS